MDDLKLKDLFEQPKSHLKTKLYTGQVCVVPI